MNYWEGIMDWPIDSNWQCEICGEKARPQWGLIHAQCRCITCHAQYRMRNDKDEVVTRPICQLKTEYNEPVKLAWEKYHIPLEELSDEQWAEFIKQEVV